MAYKKSNPNGQATMANSEPVVLASDQSAVPVSSSTFATTAKQDTQITHLATLAGAVAGTEVQVDVLTMPTVAVTGTFWQATQPVSIASAVPVTDNSGSLTVDAPVGTPVFVRLSDGAAAITTLPVSVASLPSHAVTNVGVFAVQVDGAALTSLQLIDDVIKTLGTDTYTEASTKGAVIGAVRRDANTSLVDTTNEIAPLQVNATGELKVAQIQAIPAGTNNIGDVDIASIAAGDNNIGNVDIVTLPGDVEADIDQIRDQIDLITPDVEEIRVDSDAIRVATELMDDTVFADDAAVTLGTSKGNISAGVAVATDGTDPTAVSAEGDAAALRTDMNRLLIVNQTHPRFFHVSADYASAQTNVSVKAAPGAGLSLYITDITLSNGATAGNITLLDGSGGTVLYELYPAINGGATLSLRNPIKLTANTALCITSTTVTTHSIFVSGYIAP